MQVTGSEGQTASADQSFVVGRRNSDDGPAAVITLPLPYYPEPATPGANVTIPLDAQGSFPAPDSTIAQYVWKVVSGPDPDYIIVTEARGRTATVSLPSGNYLVSQGALLPKAW